MSLSTDAASPAFPPDIPLPRSARSSSVAQLLWPLAAAAIALVLLGPLGGDVWIADRLFALQGGQWALREHVVTQEVIHRGGRALSVTLWCAFAILWLLARSQSRWRTWRRPLGALLLSVLLSTTLVAVLKRLLQVDCPWDIERYGGTQPLVALFAQRPAGLAEAHCFPAAHASVGYACVALYFFFAVVAPRWRHIGLVTGLALGLCFGWSQQLRGAHFLSHDVVTLALCWTVALVVHRAINPADPATTRQGHAT